MNIHGDYMLATPMVSNEIQRHPLLRPELGALERLDMLHATLRIDPSDVVAPVNRRLFGGFVEQMGRGVYGGIFAPGDPRSDENGFRLDVAELVRELGISMVRYPGGNFVSGYRWEDGIGPVAERPTRLDLAWHAIDDNSFGLDEFVKWCRLLQIEPMMAVNLGTRGVEEAIDLLEYCNVPGGTRLSDLRRANGSPEPHNIRAWCLGNEVDGPWQVGQKTAADYAVLARTTARAMRRVDPDLELVACGSSGWDMPTFGEWERVVLTETYDEVDYISAHMYYEELDGDLASFLASAVHLDRYIEDVIHTADHVRAVKKSKKRINISFDEWNVWYQSAQPPVQPGWHAGAPRLEDRYTNADAVVTGSMLISLLRHSDRVHIAALAQLVNVIAPIVTDPDTGTAWKQTTFHPFALTAERARGVVLDGSLTAPTHDTHKHGEVPSIDAVATWDPDTATISVFAVNRSPHDDIELTVDVRGLEPIRVHGSRVVGGENLHDRATIDSPIPPHSATTAAITDGMVRVHLAAASWLSVQLSTVNNSRN